MRPILCFSVFCLCLLSVQGVTVAPNHAHRFGFESVQGERLVRVRARLSLGKGQESWGGYYLRLRCNGAALTSSPINAGNLWDIGWVPVQRFVQHKSSEDAWFVRADSNWLAYDGDLEGSVYSKAGYLQSHNVKGDPHGYTNAYYDKVFRLGGDVMSLEVENLSKRYPMICEVLTVPLSDELLFYAPVAGTLIYPWTFPTLEDVPARMAMRVCPGEGDCAMLGVRNLGEGSQTLTWRLSELRSSTGAVLPPSAVDVRIQARIAGNKEYNDADILTYAKLAGHRIEVPERLVSQQEWRIDGGKTGALWLLVTVPKATPAGRYTGTMTFNGRWQVPVSVEVLPFELEPLPRMVGLWTNSLPGAVERRDLQVKDLQSHGINTLLLDGWTVRVPVDQAGKPNLKHFIWTLSWMKEQGFNRHGKLFYGLLDPLLGDIGKAAGTQQLDDPRFIAVAKPIFKRLTELANAEGFDIYYHGVDEPDVHPKEVKKFESFCRMIRQCGGKIMSNNTVAGMRHWGEMIDINIAGIGAVADAWKGLGYVNDFYPQWGECPAEYTRNHAHYAYLQVRSTQPLSARQHFGLLSDRLGMRGIWGFAYHWGKNEWHIGWPFKEVDGKTGTTLGWEMFHAGIQDSRYLLTLQAMARRRGRKVAFRLPSVETFERSDMKAMAGLRNQMIDEIMTMCKEGR